MGWLIRYILKPTKNAMWLCPEMDYIGYIPILDDISIEKLGIN